MTKLIVAGPNGVPTDYTLFLSKRDTVELIASLTAQLAGEWSGACPTFRLADRQSFITIFLEADNG